MGSWEECSAARGGGRAQAEPKRAAGARARAREPPRRPAPAKTLPAAASGGATRDERLGDVGLVVLDEVGGVGGWAQGCKEKAEAGAGGRLPPRSPLAIRPEASQSSHHTHSPFPSKGPLPGRPQPRQRVGGGHHQLPPPHQAAGDERDGEEPRRPGGVDQPGGWGGGVFSRTEGWMWAERWAWGGACEMTRGVACAEREAPWTAPHPAALTPPPSRRRLHPAPSFDPPAGGGRVRDDPHAVPPGAPALAVLLRARRPQGAGRDGGPPGRGGAGAKPQAGHGPIHQGRGTVRGPGLGGGVGWGGAGEGG
jgi:hypothetical protein